MAEALSGCLQLLLLLFARCSGASHLNLTIAMLNEFIDKILVHERDRKGSIQTTQEIEIYFNFVGKFVPPHFMEVELTPEQQEELRKREERKDRLHQNYLKRKASGAQKRYEDKIGSPILH